MNGIKMKSAKSLAQNFHEKMMFGLMMKLKELEGAGFSASEIDEQLPLPREVDKVLPSNKRLRRVFKKEEETLAYA
jgi:hypothetical protein